MIITNRDIFQRNSVVAVNSLGSEGGVGSVEIVPAEEAVASRAEPADGVGTAGDGGEGDVGAQVHYLPSPVAFDPLLGLGGGDTAHGGG